jgi:hypothetical protein
LPPHIFSFGKSYLSKLKTKQKSNRMNGENQTSDVTTCSGFSTSNECVKIPTFNL